MSSSELEDFKRRDAASYDLVADSYERFADQFIISLARRVVDLAALNPLDRVLDVGAGTGVVSLEAARRVCRAGGVIALDLSDAMLDRARARAAAENLNSRINFVLADAERLDFADKSVDVVLSLFAIMHFPNPGAAVAEMFRVLRPGGRVVMGFGSGPPLISIAFIHAVGEHLAAWIAEQFGRRLTAPYFLNALTRKSLPESEHLVESCLARSGCRAASIVTEFLARAGFEGIQSCWAGNEVLLKTAEEFWELQATFSSVVRKRLADAPAETVAGIRKEFFEICRRVQRRNGHLVYRSGARIISARRS
jgi:ubiquinone/menaquinone biosynthesis C-methylase UbiE